MAERSLKADLNPTVTQSLRLVRAIILLAKTFIVKWLGASGDVKCYSVHNQGYNLPTPTPATLTHFFVSKVLFPPLTPLSSTFSSQSS
jgi:hypothetical protein